MAKLSMYPSVPNAELVPQRLWNSQPATTCHKFASMSPSDGCNALSELPDLMSNTYMIVATCETKCGEGAFVGRVLDGTTKVMRNQ